MAVRRGIGAGLTALSQMMLHHNMQMEESRTTQRNAQLNQLMEQLGKTPENWQQLLAGASSLPNMKGVDLSGLRPSDNTLTSGMVNQVQGAKSPLDLPVDPDVMGTRMGVNPLPPEPLNAASFGAVGDTFPRSNPAIADIKGLMSQKQGMFDQEDASKVTQAGNIAGAQANASEGAKLDYAYPLADASAYGAGQTAGAQARAVLAPDITQGQTTLAGKKAGAEQTARNASDITQGPQLNDLAGKKAGLVANAQQEAEWLNPNVMAAKLQDFKRKSELTAAQTRNTEHLKIADQATTTIMGIQPDLQKLQELSGKVNTMAPGDPRRMGTKAGAFMGTNVPADEMNRIAANLAKRLANDPMIGGNRGAQSEKDSEAILGRLPTAGTSKELAQKLLADFNANLYKGLEAFNKQDLTADPMVRVNSYRQSLGLPPVDPNAIPGVEGGFNPADIMRRPMLPQPPGQKTIF